MKRLEIVLLYDRVGQKVDALQQIWPDLVRIMSSDFYHIFRCEVEALSQEQRQLLEKLVAAKVIINFCCKERGRTFKERPSRLR
jgi:hypothetical protein